MSDGQIVDESRSAPNCTTEDLCRRGEIQKGPVTDEPGKSFYYEPVLRAVENGLTSGTGATTFSPVGICNRARVVTFLYAARKQPQPPFWQ